MRSGIIEPMHSAVASNHFGRASFIPIIGT